MPNYIVDGTTSYGSLTDSNVFPKINNITRPTIPNNQKIRDVDYNILDQALQDTRAWFYAQQYSIFAPGVDPTPAGFGGVGQNPYLFADAARLPQWKASGIAAGFVLDTRTINTTAGHLVGGGALTSDLTLGLATVGPGAGTIGGAVRQYITSTTLDAQGRTTAATAQFNPYFNVLEFGAVGDGVTDNTAAFTAAIAALGPPATAFGATLLVPHGVFRFADHLIIDRNMVLRGSVGSGKQSRSVLLFAEGKGIKITSQTGAPGTETGQHATIEHLNITSEGNGTGTVRFRVIDTGDMSRLAGTVSVTTTDAHLLSTGNTITMDGAEDNFPRGDKVVTVTGANTFTFIEAGADATSVREHSFVYSTRPPVHGIDSRSTCNINRCYIFGFGGHGVQLLASSNVLTSDPIYGNANGSSISHCFIENNVLHGLFCAGDDSQGGQIAQCQFISNGLGGVYDSSFLGNTYTGCLVEANLDDTHPGAAYWIDGGVNFSTLVGCYSESNLRPGTLGPAGMVFGGDLAAQYNPAPGSFPGFDQATSIGLRMLTYNQITPFIVTSNDGPGFRQVHLGSKGAVRVFGFRAAEDSELIDVKYNNYLTGHWSWERAGIPYFTMTDSNATLGANKLLFPSGYYLKAQDLNAFPLQSSRSAAPVSGTFTRGDFLWDPLPVVAGSGAAEHYRIGFMCVASGSPGTWEECHVGTADTMLSGALTGSGTTNSITKWTGTSTIGNSTIGDTGTSISIDSANTDVTHLGLSSSFKFISSYNPGAAAAYIFDTNHSFASTDILMEYSLNGAAAFRLLGGSFNPVVTNNKELGLSSAQWLNTYSRRYFSNGTNLVSGDMTLTNFGTGASVVVGADSDDTHGFITVTAGTSPSANPFVTITFKDGTWTTAPHAIAVLEASSDSQAHNSLVQCTTTATTLVITLNSFTPANTQTYRIRWLTIGL